MKKPGATVIVEYSCPMTRKQAEAIYAQGPEAVVFVLMDLATKAACQPGQGEAGLSPSTPSGMVPVYEKPTARKRRKKPGAKAGHPGRRRQAPEPTRHQEHPPLASCPDCGSRLGKPAERRFRLIEDIPDTEPEVTKHSITRQWCAKCNKFVEPPVPDALPGSTFGHRLVTLTAWLHYGLGTTISQIIAVLNHHLRFRLSEGGLVKCWQRLGAILAVWYRQIEREVKASGVLHADQTGWRVGGKTQWLWCFTTKGATFYMIERSRGSPALLKFFTEADDGILVTDFWAAYNAVVCAGRQACLPHLLREMEKVDKKDQSASWAAFRKKLRRLLRDALRLSGRPADLTEEVFTQRRARLGKRLDALVASAWDNANARRLVKRLKRYRDALFTFLDHADVPSDNNHAEREIRPAVIMRKDSLCNRSKAGADTQAILMSVYRTLKLRGLDPLRTIVSALREYVSTGQLPALPAPSTSLG